MQLRAAKQLGWCLLALITLAGPPAWSGTVFYETEVERVLVDSVYYGGCMAFLKEAPSNGCHHWVTFSCAGDFNEQVFGFRKLDQAQLALAAGKRVRVIVDDSKKHNGYCFARRIDVYK